MLNRGILFHVRTPVSSPWHQGHGRPIEVSIEDDSPPPRVHMAVYTTVALHLQEAPIQDTSLFS